MNVIHFNEKTCERIRRHFDSYLDNELLVETNHEVLRHLAVCADCTKVLDDRARLKAVVKRAVQQEHAPAALLESVRSQIHGRRRFLDFNVRHFALAVAAIIILVAVSVTAIRTKVFAPEIEAGRQSFEVISTKAQELMRIGLVDHVHCALVVGKWKELLSLDQMRQAEGNGALGPEFIGLVPLVTEQPGPNFHMVQGHRCVANRRQYVLLLTGDKGTILSLVITQKNRETFGRAEIAATLQASGIPVYSAHEGQLEIAGFETNRFLVFVVSDLDHDGNLKVASDLVPPVYEFLRRLEA